MRDLNITKDRISFLKEQISETKRVMAKSRYPPYINELNRSLEFWQNELKKHQLTIRR